jgi:hypothetical protein
MNTNSISSAVSGFVLVFSKAFLDGKPLTQPLLVMAHGRVVAKPDIRSCILITDAAGKLIGQLPSTVDHHGVTVPGEIITHSQEELLQLQEYQEAPEAQAILRATCWDIAGQYIHNTISWGPLMVPVPWGASGGHPMFRRTHKLNMANAIHKMPSPEATPGVDMANSGWVLTRENGDPIIDLPFKYPAKSEDGIMEVASYKEAIASSDKVYLARQAPYGDPWEEFIASITISGEQSAGDALNSNVGVALERQKRPVRGTPAEHAEDGQTVDPVDAEL